MIKYILSLILILNLNLYSDILFCNGGDTKTDYFPVPNIGGTYTSDTYLTFGIGNDATGSRGNNLLAYKTIGGAYADALSGDEIWVLSYNDTYYESTQFNPSIKLKMVSNGAEWVLANINQPIRMSDSGDTIEMYGFILNFENTDFSNAFLFIGDDNLIINYNQIINSFPTTSPIYFNGTTQEVQFKNNYIYNTKFSSSGGSVILPYSKCYIQNNIFDKNFAGNVAGDFMTDNTSNSFMTFNYITSATYDDFVNPLGDGYQASRHNNNFSDSTIVNDDNSGCTTLTKGDLLYIASTGETYPYNFSDTFGLDLTGYKFANKYWNRNYNNYTDFELSNILNIAKIDTPTKSDVLSVYETDSQSSVLNNDYWDSEVRTAVIIDTDYFNADTQYTILNNSYFEAIKVNDSLFNRNYVDSGLVINVSYNNDSPTKTSPINVTVTNKTVPFIFPIQKFSKQILLQVAEDGNFTTNVDYETSPLGINLTSINHTFSTNGVKYWRIKKGKGEGFIYE